MDSDDRDADGGGSPRIDAAHASVGGMAVFVNNRTDLSTARPHQPYLVDMATMALLEEPTTFIDRHYVQTGRRSSPNTWKAAADHLLLWLEFLRIAEIPWQLATRDDLVRYRNALLESISPHTGRRYKPVTIRNRMLTVIQFYEFSGKRGWYSGSLHSDDILEVTRRNAIDLDALAHIRKGSAATHECNELLPVVKRSNDKIRPFSVKEWRSFALALGPLPSERTSADKRSSRNRLLCEVGLATGMRLNALRTLETLPFLAMHPDPEAPAAHQQLIIINKGGGTISIRIPNWLVLEILLYIETERADLIKSAGRKGRGEPRALFLSGMDSSRPGFPMSARRYQQIVEEACIAAGLVTLVTERDPDSGAERIVQKHKHCVHDLRHTYAVWTYFAERKRGNREPWKNIQAQLGHASLSTTIDTYLSVVEIFGGFEPAIDVRAILGL